VATRLSVRWLAATLALVLGAASLSVLAATSAEAGSTKHDSITISNFMYAPMVIDVQPGATIKVTNKDSVTHTLSAVDGKFNTGNIRPGATKSFKAPKKPGKYHYICMIHQFMTGTIVVK
jgi:plastocyanin